MGSGSRIDHQHHRVALTEHALVGDTGTLTVQEPRARPVTEVALPPVSERIPYLANDESSLVWLPTGPAAVHERLAAGEDVLAQAIATVSDGYTTTDLHGHLLISQDADGSVHVDAQGMLCDEPSPITVDQNGLCGHQRAAGRIVEQHLNALAGLAAGRAAAQQVLAEVADEHAASVAAQQQAREAHAAQPAVASYEQDMAAFQAVYNQARARRSAGEPLVPYRTDNATDGLGAREGGRGFGVELEFDFPPRMSYASQSEAKQAIAREMHEAGLSPDSRLHDWHASARAGYSDRADAWRVEYDATVAGEIVSPILYDEPQTWANLTKVCEIVRRHGGVATARTGGHVHVAVADFDHTVGNHNQLLNTVAGYQDVLYRLAQNPNREEHRGLRYCSPNHTPSRPYRSVTQFREHNSSHEIGLNFQSVRGERSDHAEFRMWDGSLEPAVIQAQVNASLGLTHAALREAGTTAPPTRQWVGQHRRILAESDLVGRRLSGEMWEINTRSFRSLVDRIFTSEESKAQLTALFAGTRWHRGHR